LSNDHGAIDTRNDFLLRDKLRIKILIALRKAGHAGRQHSGRDLDLICGRASAG